MAQAPHPATQPDSAGHTTPVGVSELEDLRARCGALHEETADLRRRLAGMAGMYRDAVDSLNTGFEGYFAVLLWQLKRQRGDRQPVRQFAAGLTTEDVPHWPPKYRDRLPRAQQESD